MAPASKLRVAADSRRPVASAEQTSMKALRASLVSPLLLTACLELEETVLIRPDGSGTQRVRVGVTERGEHIVNAFSDSDADGGTSFVDEAFDTDVVRRKLSSAGMRCRMLRSYERDGMRTVDVAAEFSDLDALRKSPLRGGQAEWRFERGPMPDTVRLVMFPRGEAAWRSTFRQAQRIGDAPTADQQETYERAKAEMDGMSLHWTIELPGAVVGHSRNLQRLDRKRVQAVITGADIDSPRDLVRQMAPRYEVVFDSRGCSFALDPDPDNTGG